jgi:hypothetical protein
METEVRRPATPVPDKWKQLVGKALVSTAKYIAKQTELDVSVFSPYC